MNSRSANATIKGYLYQFDKTILQILELSSPLSSVVVEGIEDIDFDDGDLTYVQCKYYEGTSYTHSVIKDSVVNMLKHYHTSPHNSDHGVNYLVYGHYKDGQDKLPETLDIGFVKENFLTYRRSINKGGLRLVHEEIGISDASLMEFLSKLHLDVNALSYDEQIEEIYKKLALILPSYKESDIEIFLYPRAISVIQKLAINTDLSKRQITKSDFIRAIDQQGFVLTTWLRRLYDTNKYAKLIRKQYFNPVSNKMTSKARVFVMDFNHEFDLAKITNLLTEMAEYFSHVEHKRTNSDRFCPYIVAYGLNDNELIKVKTELSRAGVCFSDGYKFLGADFCPKTLAEVPTKGNLVRLKFIPSVQKISEVIHNMESCSVEIFDMYKKDFPIVHSVPEYVKVNQFKIDSVFFLQEVMKP